LRGLSDDRLAPAAAGSTGASAADARTGRSRADPDRAGSAGPGYVFGGRALRRGGCRCFAHSGDGASILSALEAANIETWALTPSGGEPLQTVKPPPRLAIVLGAEGPGLPTTLIDRCRRISIPMAPGIDSLNVAAAGAIALSHVLISQRA